MNLTGFDMVNIHKKSELNYRKKALSLLECSHRSQKREVPFFYCKRIETQSTECN